MLAESLVAVFLLICFGCFSLFNVHTILKGKKLRKRQKTYAEIERPSGPFIGLAAAGTIVYFLEVLAYILLVATNLISALFVFPLFFQFPRIFGMQILGLVLTASGYVVFIWSVGVRGRYAVSWEMPGNQKLITWGPYGCVRHPSYLGYFLMFFGLFFLWPNLFTLFPLAAIPGYYRVTFVEERLLVQRFGKEYLEYKRKTGRFIPKVR
jgi:protein-S-isoprenylcysteine O-methyltransferase Ste14